MRQMREMIEMNTNHFAFQAKMIKNYRIGFVVRTFRLFYYFQYYIHLTFDE